MYAQNSHHTLYADFRLPIRSDETRVAGFQAGPAWAHAASGGMQF